MATPLSETGTLSESEVGFQLICIATGLLGGFIIIGVQLATLRKTKDKLEKDYKTYKAEETKEVVDVIKQFRSEIDILTWWFINTLLSFGMWFIFCVTAVSMFMIRFKCGSTPFEADVFGNTSSGISYFLFHCGAWYILFHIERAWFYCKRVLIYKKTGMSRYEKSTVDKKDVNYLSIYTLICLFIITWLFGYTMSYIFRILSNWQFMSYPERCLSARNIF